MDYRIQKALDYLAEIVGDDLDSSKKARTAAAGALLEFAAQGSSRHELYLEQTPAPTSARLHPNPMEDSPMRHAFPDHAPIQDVRSPNTDVPKTGDPFPQDMPVLVLMPTPDGIAAAEFYADRVAAAEGPSSQLVSAARHGAAAMRGWAREHAAPAEVGKPVEEKPRAGVNLAPEIPKTESKAVVPPAAK